MTHAARRVFLLGAAGAGLTVVGCRGPSGADPKTPADPKHTGEGGEAGVTPTEDLMREHGVLNRILLIYDESARRLEAQEPLPGNALAKSADIIRRFIEQYHEKLEEDFVFPRLEKAAKLVELVTTLRRQHQAGRALTDAILALSTATALQDENERKKLVASLRSFTRMYRPHETREDTVLFPAFRELVGGKELRDLGERFEDKEHELFGKKGFEGIVGQVAAIERVLGIFDLDKFTPAT